MTLKFRDNDGKLEVWTVTDDPSTDPPAKTTSEWSGGWPVGGHPVEAERLIEEWLKEEGIPSDIGYQDVARILIDLRAGNFDRV